MQYADDFNKELELWSSDSNKKAHASIATALENVNINIDYIIKLIAVNCINNVKNTKEKTKEGNGH